MDDPQPPGADSALPAFDRPALLERMMDDEELAAEIIASFLADTPAQVAALEDAFARGDMPGTGKLAHRVKGAAANLSAVRLQSLASELEMVARAGQRGEAARLVARVRDEYLAAESAMRLSIADR